LSEKSFVGQRRIVRARGDFRASSDAMCVIGLLWWVIVGVNRKTFSKDMTSIHTSIK